MSDSNVGARRGKNIRNHIFVLNGIINDVLNSKGRHPVRDPRLQAMLRFYVVGETLNYLYNGGLTDADL